MALASMSFARMAFAKLLPFEIPHLPCPMYASIKKDYEPLNFFRSTFNIFYLFKYNWFFFIDVTCGPGVNSDGFDFSSDYFRRDGQCEALLRCTEIHQGDALT